MPAKPQARPRRDRPGRVVIDPGPPGINPRPPAGCPPARPEATQPLTEDAAAAFVRLNGGGEIRGLKLFEDTVNIRVELDLGAPTAREEATAEPPERDRPPDLEASMDGSIVMALATPSDAPEERALRGARATSERYVEYGADGRVIKGAPVAARQSRYAEDVHESGHESSTNRGHESSTNRPRVRATSRPRVGHEPATNRIGSGGPFSV